MAGAQDLRIWPGYNEFGIIAALEASLGRLYVVVDMETHKQIGEAYAAGGGRWAADCLTQFNVVYGDQQPRPHVKRVRHCITSWAARDFGGGVQLWYRSPVRQHSIARRAALVMPVEAQDSSFIRGDQRVMLVYARWRKSSPHAKPTEPAQPGDDTFRLHGRVFRVARIDRTLANGRTPDGRQRLGIRTAMVYLAPSRV